MVAVSAICADTDEQAEWLSGPAVLSFLRLRQTAGPAGCRRRRKRPRTRTRRPSGRSSWGWTASHVVGTPDAVRDQLHALAALRTGANGLTLTGPSCTGTPSAGVSYALCRRRRCSSRRRVTS